METAKRITVGHMSPLSPMSPLEIRKTKFWKIFRGMMEGKRIS
jgi:hypothetical protein